jgi:hypothetical protein
MAHINDADLHRKITEWGRMEEGNEVTEDRVNGLLDMLGFKPHPKFGDEFSGDEANGLRIGSSVVDRDGDVWVKQSSTTWNRSTYYGRTFTEGRTSRLLNSWGPFRFIGGGWYTDE